MDETETPCPVCLSRDGFSCTSSPFPQDSTLFNCEVCGRFLVTREAHDDFLDRRMSQFTAVRRATLSYQIRTFSDSDSRPSLWTTASLQAFLENSITLPNTGQQATNIIRYIGDIVTVTGEPLDVLSPAFPAIIGSASRDSSYRLLAELNAKSLINARYFPDGTRTGHFQEISLSLDGWDLYERERKGRIASNYGFFALKFGDSILDPLVRDHIKPALSAIGYNVVDLRDVSKAGIIDNLLRVQIRDSAFVIVDLTHENSGAYWEAGYAEGLGKPVLYICEKNKFEQNKTHFDTNHCTTVLWQADDTREFLDSLIATLKRSLDI